MQRLTTLRTSRVLQCVYSKGNRTSAPLIHTETLLQLYIHRYCSISRFDLCTDLFSMYLLKILPIPWHPVLCSIFHFVTRFHYYIYVFRIAKMIGPYKLFWVDSNLLSGYSGWLLEYCYVVAQMLWVCKHYLINSHVTLLCRVHCWLLAVLCSMPIQPTVIAGHVPCFLMPRASISHHSIGLVHTTPSP